MKVISLLPQDATKQRPLPVSSTRNIVTLSDPKQKSVSVEFDSIFRTPKDEASSFDLTKPTTLIAMCTTGSFENKNAVSETVECFSNCFFSVNYSSKTTLKIARISKSEYEDLLFEQEAVEQQLTPVKNANECSDLTSSVLTDLSVSSNAIIYVSFIASFTLDLIFIPIQSTVMNDIAQIIEKPNTRAQNKIYNQLSQSIKNGRNVVIDCRFGNQCGYSENCKALQSIDLFKKIVPILISKPEEVAYKTTPMKQKTPTKSLIPSPAKTPTKSSIHSPAKTPVAETTTSTTSPKKDEMVQWKKFITRPVKGKDGKPKQKNGVPVTYIDKSRLVCLARKVAYDPEAKQEEIDGILKEIEEQIADSVNYHAGVGETVVNLNSDVIISREEESKLAKEERNLKQHYMELKAYNKSDENAHDSVMIGDKEDYQIANECLSEEVESLEKELAFLRLAFPDVNVTQNEEEEEEEI